MKRIMARLVDYVAFWVVMVVAVGAMTLCLVLVDRVHGRAFGVGGGAPARSGGVVHE